MENVRIRLAGPEDFDLLRELYEHVDRPHREWYPEKFAEPAGGRRDDANLQAYLEDPTAQTWLLEAAGDAAGMALVFDREIAAAGVLQQQHFLLVDVIVVAEAHRGKGYGKRLLAHVKTDAKRRGISTIRLKVYLKNEAAIGFYQSEGFAVEQYQMVLEDI